MKTDSGCANHSNCNVVDDTLMTYPMYWCSSVNDWYWASGDTKRFLEIAPDMARIVDHAIATFLQPNLPVAFFGWDDRIANGFCGSCNLEVQLGFAALVIRACGDFAATLAHAGDSANATRYNATAARLAAQLRARPASARSKGGNVGGGGGKNTRTDAAWHDDYGVHAAAYAINARILATPAEVETLVNRELSDAVTVCSWSPFNNYWILQALGNAGRMDQAGAFIKLCWGPMLELGKGCFWELFSPEWASWMKDGDKAPTSPSYCHPWASGVTHWLSTSMAGVVALAPGYSSFVAMPHVSVRHPSVAASQPTPHGTIVVHAALVTNRRLHSSSSSGGSSTTTSSTDGSFTPFVRVEVTSSKRTSSRYVGLRVADETTGCALNVTTISVSARHQHGVAPAVLSSLPGHGRADCRVHLAAQNVHVFVKLPPGSVVITAAYESTCAPTMVLAAAAAALVATTREATARASRAAPTPSTSARIGPTSSDSPLAGLPTIPPFPAPSYPGSWSVDKKTGGDWIGKYGHAGYSLFAFDEVGNKNVAKLPSWVCY